MMVPANSDSKSKLCLTFQSFFSAVDAGDTQSAVVCSCPGSRVCSYPGSHVQVNTDFLVLLC